MGFIILAIFVILILLLLFLPIRLTLSFSRDGVKNEASLVLRYSGLKITLFDSTKKKEKKEKPEKEKEKEPFSFDREKARLEKYINIFENIKQDIGNILKYTGGKALVFENVKVHLEFGFENAMNTGIFTGLANGFIYSVLGVIHQHSKLEKMDINVQPVFDKTCFCADVGCILRSKNVHIIIIAFNVLKILRKIRKIERRS